MKKQDWVPFVGTAIFVTLIAFLYRNRNRQINENIADNGANMEATQATTEEEPSLKTIETLLKKQDLNFRRSVWVTVAAFGGSIILVGLTLFINKQVQPSNLFPSDDVFLILFGFAVMIVAYLGSQLQSRTETISITRARRWFTLSKYFLITGAASIAVTLVILKLLPSLHIIAFFFVPFAFLSIILAAIFLGRGLWIRIKG
jgi:hypothetical protein